MYKLSTFALAQFIIPSHSEVWAKIIIYLVCHEGYALL